MILCRSFWSLSDTNRPYFASAEMKDGPDAVVLDRKGLQPRKPSLFPSATGPGTAVQAGGRTDSIASDTVSR